MIGIVVLFGVRFAIGAAMRSSDELLFEGPCIVQKVVAGDRLVIRQVRDGHSLAPVSMRLGGVRVPLDHDEAQRRAAEFCSDWLRDHPRVRVRLDRRRIDAERTQIAYLIADHDGWLGVELVQAGWAYAEPQPGDLPSLARRLRSAQAEARSERRGIWATPAT